MKEGGSNHVAILLSFVLVLLLLFFLLSGPQPVLLTLEAIFIMYNTDFRRQEEGPLLSGWAYHVHGLGFLIPWLVECGSGFGKSCI